MIFPRFLSTVAFEWSRFLQSEVSYGVVRPAYASCLSPPHPPARYLTFSSLPAFYIVPSSTYTLALTIHASHPPFYPPADLSKEPRPML